MGTVILDMSMSLDGFIAGPKDDDKPDRELGGLDILHDWRFAGKSSTETEAYEVEKFKVIEDPGVTYFRFRVVK